MERAFTIPTPNLIVQMASLAVIVIGPFVAAVIAQRRLAAGWRIFWLGALVFIISQMLLRIPLVGVLQSIMAPHIASSSAMSVVIGALLAVTAALFETGGRVLGSRFLLRREPKNWGTGVMFGLGHGGIESSVLIGGLALAQLAALLTTTASTLQEMPPLQADALRTLADDVANGPAWLGLRGAYERVVAVTFHVAMSLLVMQSFIRGEQRWTWYALGAHSLMDFIVPTLLPLLLAPGIARIVVQQLTLTAFGGLALMMIIALRPTGYGRVLASNSHSPS
jgi:uncharacterized membrane protein YhfC